MSSGQVLQDPYEFEKGKVVAREMTDQLALDLVEKHLVTDQLVLTVGYDTSNLSDPMRRRRYNGPVHINHYGKPVPKEAHGSVNLERFTSSGRIITEAMMGLFDRCVDPNLLVRRITVVANHIISENDIPADKDADQPENTERITTLYRQWLKDNRKDTDGVIVSGYANQFLAACRRKR